MELPSEKAARQIASRSVGLRCCMELWARAKTEEELHKNIQSYPLELMKPYFKPELSFKINVETFCNRQSQAEKVAKIEVCMCIGQHHHMHDCCHGFLMPEILWGKVEFLAHYRHLTFNIFC